MIALPLLDRLDEIRLRLKQRTIRGADVDLAQAYDLAWVVVRRGRWRRTLWIQMPRAETEETDQRGPTHE